MDELHTLAPSRALVIVAHADDIEFGMGGLVARWVGAGTHVTYCIVTDNRSGSNAPDADLDALGVLRQDEQCRAAELLGVKDVQFLGYPDGALTPTLALRRDLTRVIRTVRPDVVVTMDPETIVARDVDYINHPDHRAVGEAGLYAVFPSSESRPIFPELLAEGLAPHKVRRVLLTLSNQPNLWVDVSDVYARKQGALRCHASQLGPGFEALEMIATWDALAGRQIGARYAEVFREVRLDAMG